MTMDPSSSPSSPVLSDTKRTQSLRFCIDSIRLYACGRALPMSKFIGPWQRWAWNDGKGHHAFRGGHWRVSPEGKGNCTFLIFRSLRHDKVKDDQQQQWTPNRRKTQPRIWRSLHPLSQLKCLGSPQGKNPKSKIQLAKKNNSIKLPPPAYTGKLHWTATQPAGEDSRDPGCVRHGRSVAWAGLPLSPPPPKKQFCRPGAFDSGPGEWVGEKCGISRRRQGDAGEGIDTWWFVVIARPTVKKMLSISKYFAPSTQLGRRWRGCPEGGSEGPWRKKIRKIISINNK